MRRVSTGTHPAWLRPKPVAARAVWMGQAPPMGWFEKWTLEGRATRLVCVREAIRAAVRGVRWCGGCSSTLCGKASPPLPHPMQYHFSIAPALIIAPNKACFAPQYTVFSICAAAVIASPTEVLPLPAGNTPHAPACTNPQARTHRRCEQSQNYGSPADCFAEAVAVCVPCVPMRQAGLW